MDSTGSRQGPIARLGECVKNIWVPPKTNHFLTGLNICQLFKKGRAPFLPMCLYKCCCRIFALILGTWLASIYETLRANVGAAMKRLCVSKNDR